MGTWEFESVPVSIINAALWIGGFLRDRWTAFVDNHDALNLVAIGGFVVMMLTYWLFGGAMLIVDVYHWPNWLWRRKYQQKRVYEHKGSDYNPPMLRMLALVLFNQCVIFLPGFFLLQLLLRDVDILPWRLGVRVDRVLPSITEMVFTFTVAVIFEEFCFYYSHWLLHRPLLYRHVHKVHHSYKAPHTLASLYAHPVEALLGNLLAMNIPLFVCNFHLLTFYIAICLGWMSSLVGHCGYNLPVLSWFVPKHDFHDLHHEKFSGNYGTAGWLDRLLGTEIKVKDELVVV